jgi:tRNA/tmRNA/rRNA uracil-C5-methylase (TrmA/RlmC/RlmD family)
LAGSTFPSENDFDVAFDISNDGSSYSTAHTKSMSHLALLGSSHFNQQQQPTPSSSQPFLTKSKPPAWHNSASASSFMPQLKTDSHKPLSHYESDVYSSKSKDAFAFIRDSIAQLDLDSVNEKPVVSSVTGKPLFSAERHYEKLKDLTENRQEVEDSVQRRRHREILHRENDEDYGGSMFSTTGTTAADVLQFENMVLENSDDVMVEGTLNA